ncbi:MAG: MoxR family ATPase, partial [Pyrinomonadaceae bacterium]
IMLSLDKEDEKRQQDQPYLPERRRGVFDARSVVLIDEIDKAPRDLPNDILNEIEEMKFEVKEIDAEFEAKEENRPIVILTSNSEKNLPDAFLRRCVFYHIDFPGKDELLKIVESRLGAAKSDVPDDLRKKAVDHFIKIRDLKLKKLPATAELLAWIKTLERLKLDFDKKDQQESLIFTYSILAKNNEDIKTFKRELHPESQNIRPK